MCLSRKISRLDRYSERTNLETFQGVTEDLVQVWTRYSTPDRGGGAVNIDSSTGVSPTTRGESVTLGEH